MSNQSSNTTSSTRIQGQLQDKRNALLDKNGRIVIPESVRSEKHLRPGVPVNLSIYPDGIWIATNPKVAIQQEVEELRSAFGDRDVDTVMEELREIKREMFEERHPGLHAELQAANERDRAAKTT